MVMKKKSKRYMREEIGKRWLTWHNERRDWKKKWLMWHNERSANLITKPQLLYIVDR
jgi:hypothetical protein